MIKDLHTMDDLIAVLEQRLDTEITADNAARTRILTEVQALIDRYKSAGTCVPLRLCAMERALLDDVTDDNFDNMPV